MRSLGKDAAAVKLTFLGTGTSVGIPVIGCSCRVCVSPDPRNRRLRSSAWLQAGGLNLVVDTSPDFREQALRQRIPRVDAVLFTHSHADHIFGFDDLRRFNTIQNQKLPAYASPETVADLRRIFDYVERGEELPGLYRPKVDFVEVRDRFQIGPLSVTPVPVEHGPKTTLAYRIECGGRAVGYAPDCKAIGPDSIAMLRGVDVMVLDALRQKPHPTHLSLDESAEYLARIGAARSFIIHMCHDLDHEEAQNRLPESVFVSWDGLVLEW